MPVYYSNETTYKLLKINNAIIFCDSANESNSYSVSNKKMTTGIANTGFRDIGLLSRTADFSGPCLMTTGGFLGDVSYTSNGYRIVDVPTLMVDIFSGLTDYDTNILTEIPYGTLISDYDNYPIIESASLRLDNNNGLISNIKIKGNVSQIDPNAIKLEYIPNITPEISIPLRSSNWYDFFAQYNKYGSLDYSCETPDEVIVIGFNNINFDYNLDWKTIEYIGQNQYENYIYNGATVKYNIELTYNFPNRSEFNLFYQRTIDNDYGFILGMNKVIAQSWCQIDGDMLFKYRLLQLMNNYIDSSVIPQIGQQARARFMSGESCLGGANIENQIDISHKYPVSTVKISGERIFN